jgi:hypothetical protein
LATTTRSAVGATSDVDVDDDRPAVVVLAASLSAGLESVAAGSRGSEVVVVAAVVRGAEVVVVAVVAVTLIADDTTSSGTSSGRPVTAIPASSEITATTARSRIDLTAATG